MPELNNTDLRDQMRDILWDTGMDTEMEPDEGYYTESTLERILNAPRQAITAIEEEKEVGDPTVLGTVKNASLSLLEIIPSIASLPGMLYEDPVSVIEGLVKFIPEQVATVWHAIKPTVYFGEITDEDREQSDRAWKELYRDPLGPIFAWQIARSVVGSAVNLTRGAAAKSTMQAHANATTQRLMGEFGPQFESAFGTGRPMRVPGSAKPYKVNRQGEITYPGFKGAFEPLKNRAEVARNAMADQLLMPRKAPGDINAAEILQKSADDAFHAEAAEVFRRKPGVQERVESEIKFQGGENFPIASGRNNAFLRVFRAADKWVKSAPGKGMIGALKDFTGQRAKYSQVGIQIAADHGLNIHPSLISGLSIAFKNRAGKTMTAEAWSKSEVGQSFYKNLGDMYEASGGMVRVRKVDRNGKSSYIWEEFSKHRQKEYSPESFSKEALELLDTELRPYHDELANLMTAETGKMGEVGYELLAEGVFKKAAQKFVGARWESMHPKIKTAAQQMMEKGIAKSPSEAMTILFRKSQLDRRGGHMFSEKQGLIPDALKEQNLHTVVQNYVQDWARSTAEWRTFGDMNFLNRQMESIKAKQPPGSREHFVLETLYNNMTNKGVRMADNKSAAFAKNYSKFAYATKVGMGFAPLLQAGQPFISLIMEAGVYNSARSFMRMLPKRERQFIRETGAVQINAETRFLGQMDSGLVKNMFSPINAMTTFNPVARAFSGMNKALDYWSAEAGKLMVNELYTAANRTGGKLVQAQAKYAQGKLRRRFGVDYRKPLREHEQIKAMHDFAADMQLHPQATMEPIWMNDPKFRWLATLKRFGYRQAQMVYRGAFTDMKKGNVMPVLRLAVGGQLGAHLVGFAKEQIAEYATGRPVFDDQDPLWLEMLNNYALVGTMGSITDLGRMSYGTKDDMGKDIIQSGIFQAVPVAFSDLERLRRLAGVAVSGDTDPVARAKKLGTKALGIFGSGGYLVGERLESDETITKDMVRQRSQLMKRAAVAVQEGDRKTSWDIITEWNSQLGRMRKLAGNDRVLRKKIRRMSMRDVQKYIKRYMGT